MCVIQLRLPTINRHARASETAQDSLFIISPSIPRQTLARLSTVVVTRRASCDDDAVNLIIGVVLVVGLSAQVETSENGIHLPCAL